MLEIAERQASEELGADINPMLRLFDAAADLFYPSPVVPRPSDAG